MSDYLVVQMKARVEELKDDPEHGGTAGLLHNAIIFIEKLEAENARQLTELKRLRLERGMIRTGDFTISEANPND